MISLLPIVPQYYGQKCGYASLSFHRQARNFSWSAPNSFNDYFSSSLFHGYSFHCLFPFLNQSSCLPMRFNRHFPGHKWVLVIMFHVCFSEEECVQVFCRKETVVLHKYINSHKIPVVISIIPRRFWETSQRNCNSSPKSLNRNSVVEPHKRVSFHCGFSCLTCKFSHIQQRHRVIQFMLSV